MAAGRILAKLGVPAGLGALALGGALITGWVTLPGLRPAATPLSLDRKLADRLAFSGDEADLPVRETRIHDTLAMFALPQGEARPWSERPVPATVQEAGIKPGLAKAAGSTPRMVVVEAPRRIELPPKRPTHLAAAEPRPIPVLRRTEASPEPVTVLGWSLPGSQHLPLRREAAQVLDQVGGKAAALGSGGVKVVTRAASAIGDGAATAGSVIAETIGLR